MPPDTAGDSGEIPAGSWMDWGASCHGWRHLHLLHPAHMFILEHLERERECQTEAIACSPPTTSYPVRCMCVDSCVFPRGWLEDGMLVCPTSPDCMPQLSLSTPEKGMRPSPTPQAQPRYRCEHKLSFLQLHRLKGQLRKEACPWRKLGPMVPAGRGLSSQGHAASTLP